MTGAATVAAVLLAAVLLWAGVAKARHRGRTAGAFAALGLPVPRLLATVVPLAELAVAAALVLRPEAGGYAALVLLAIFTIVVIRALATGAEGGCGCFGAANDRRVSPSDVLRNGLLAGLAAIATAARRPTEPTLAAAVSVLAAGGLGAIVLSISSRRWAR